MTENRTAAIMAAAAMFLAYSLCYLLRKTMIVTSVDLHEIGAVTDSDIGLITSSFALGYALSKIPSGVAADRFQPRQLLLFALLGSATINILLSLHNSVTWLTLLWGLNGFVQGFGWAPIAIMIKEAYPDPKQRATWWSLISTSQNVGAGLAPMVITALLAWSKDHPAWLNYLPFSTGEDYWRGGFLLPSGLILFSTPFIYHYLPVFPKRTPHQQHQQQSETKHWLFGLMSQLPAAMYLLFGASIAIYLARDTISNWSLFVLTKDKAFGRNEAASCLALFEAGGIVGSLLAGILSDRVFHGRRGPVCMLYGLGFAASVAWLNSTTTVAESRLAMAITGGFLFGPQTLMGLFAMEISPPEVAGLASSLVSVCSQIGSAAGGYPISLLRTYYGTDGIYVVLSCLGLAWAGLLAPVWGARLSTKTIKEQ
eukprot:m.40674 g.40674  ORF g.40674 m.40674 type:complete len:426 (-) comp12768_c0_seq1:58-1335(-)